ncbi:MAG TPA: ABC transporter permease [Polyangiaceae bacterium]
MKPGHHATTLSEPAPNLAAKVWGAIGIYGRIAVVGIAVVVVLWALFLGIRRLGRAGRRSLLIGFTISALLGTVGLGFWSSKLPEPGGTYFVLWHQVVRVGAALSATGFVLGFSGLSLPWMFDALEQWQFGSLVAVRHVRSQKSGFLTVISVLSIAGVFVSAFALCAVISIMGGFGADLKRKILGNNAHIRVDSDQVGGFQDVDALLREVRLTKGVHAATPVAGGEAMASSASNTAGVLLRGVDPDSIGHVIDLLQNIEVGHFEYLTDTQKLADLPPDEPIGIGPGGERYLKGPRLRPWLSRDLDPGLEEVLRPPDVYPGLVIGRELAKTLHVYVGDEIRLVAPLGDLGPMGVMPRTRHFRIAAIFYSGMYEYDSSYAYTLINVAQDFLDLQGHITSIDVKVDVAENVETVRPVLAAALGRPDLRVRDWKEMNKNLFSALKLEKIATFVILSLAIAVASFCIICTLLLMVTEKSKEIAILKAIGATDGAILGIFMSEGFLIGGIGTVFGVLTGFVSCYGLEKFGVRLDPEVYYVDRLPIEVNLGDYLLVGLCALLITMLATVYPAVAASRLRPVEGIRYE